MNRVPLHAVSRNTVSADAIVLGNGIIGASVARELCIGGADVLVVDPSGPCGGTSGRCDGNLLVQAKHDETTMRLTQHSIALYRQWQDELPLDIHFHQQGTMVFFTDEAQLPQAQQRRDWLTSVGVSIDLIDADETRRREPALTGPVVAALDCADDGSVYPPAVVAALTEDIRRHGGRFLYGDGARALLTDSDGRANGVELTSGEQLHAPTVINAMGVWSPALDTNGAVPLPIRPRQGVLIVTQALPGAIRRPITEAVYMSNRTGSGHGSAPDYAFLAEPTWNGNLLIGSIRRFAGYSTHVDPVIVATMMRRALRSVPSLASVQAIRSFAGLRPWTPDNEPIIGETAVPGYVLATGHEGEGIGLAPMTAELVGNIVLDRPHSPLISLARELYSPRRLTESPSEHANERQEATDAHIG